MKQQLKMKSPNTSPKVAKKTPTCIRNTNKPGIVLIKYDTSSNSLGGLKVSSMIPEDSNGTLQESKLGVNSPSIIPMVTKTTLKPSNQPRKTRTVCAKKLKPPAIQHKSQMSSIISKIENSIHQNVAASPADNLDLSDKVITSPTRITSTSPETAQNIPGLLSETGDSISLESRQESSSPDIVCSAEKPKDEVNNSKPTNIASSASVECLEKNRLKAFNIFVKMFADENLDRLLPISKQPKDKVQAILDACERQFPDFVNRSRKRLRTYLKSCRRVHLRRINSLDPKRKANNLDTMTEIKQSNPTPAYLTSPQAEKILQIVYNNERENAMRMAEGLLPLAVYDSKMQDHIQLQYLNINNAPANDEKVVCEKKTTTRKTRKRPRKDLDNDLSQTNDRLTKLSNEDTDNNISQANVSQSYEGVDYEVIDLSWRNREQKDDTSVSVKNTSVSVNKTSICDKTDSGSDVTAGDCAKEDNNLDIDRLQRHYRKMAEFLINSAIQLEKYKRVDKNIV